MFCPEKPFRVGQRERPSDDGKAQHLFAGKEKRHGTVTAVDEYNCPTVLWDGRKTTSGYHPRFIDPVRPRKDGGR